MDQALLVERRGSGFGVQYAIADASWFVPADSALFTESLRRGASYYMPGESVPMLPRALSEDLVSLGPGVDRRAMVFDMTVDADGTCTKTEIVRARIRSRHQLTFDHVRARAGSGRSATSARDRGRQSRQTTAAKTDPRGRSVGD
ncbi:MAG: RNB domain-containing ribonuclease [Nannocystaceae bacterium]|nr:RNB domain-containing ribonuclease [Nannocystaceae bacterium]